MFAFIGTEQLIGNAERGALVVLALVIARGDFVIEGFVTFLDLFRVDALLESRGAVAFTLAYAVRRHAAVGAWRL